MTFLGVCPHYPVLQAHMLHAVLVGSDTGDEATLGSCGPWGWCVYSLCFLQFFGNGWWCHRLTSLILELLGMWLVVGAFRVRCPH